MDTISYLLLAAIVLAVVIAVWGVLRRRRPALPYVKRPSLLTNAELRFYRVLLRALPAGLVVMVKVRLMDVVTVPEKAWQEYGAPGSGMHLDFVLAEPMTLDVWLVIELDDKSHGGTEARKRDTFKDAALASAGVPVLRVRTARRYDEGDLKATIAVVVAG